MLQASARAMHQQPCHHHGVQLVFMCGWLCVFVWLLAVGRWLWLRVDFGCGNGCVLLSVAVGYVWLCVAVGFGCGLCSAAGGLSLLPPPSSSSSMPSGVAEFVVAVKDPRSSNVVQQSVNLTQQSDSSSFTALVNVSGGWDLLYNNITSARHRLLCLCVCVCVCLWFEILHNCSVQRCNRQQLSGAAAVCLGCACIDG